MYAGQVVERASADELFSNSLHPYRQGLIATLPQIGIRQKELPVIPGVVPRFYRGAEGCRFASRCSKADSTCRSLTPALRSVGAGHDAACHKV